MNGLNWFWIGLAIVAPSAAGLLAAWPLWQKGQPIFGNILGSSVIFGAAVGLIFRERVEIERFGQQCLDQGTVCWPAPSAFTRFAVYAFIALVEIMMLFSVSLRIEHRVRRRGYAPEWR